MAGQSVSVRLSLAAWITLMGTALAQPAPVLLVEEGQARAVIVVGENPSTQAKEAATELQTILRRMSGAELPVVETGPGDAQNRVLVGQAAARQAAAALDLTIPSGLTRDFDDEGYVVATGEGILVLAGNETEPYQGTLFAVYDLLESLGCRWYFPGEFGEIIPDMTTVVVPPVRKLARPALRVRDTWYSGHLISNGEQQREFWVWKRRNRMTRPEFWTHCADPNARFLQNPVDDSTYRLLPKDRYFAEHPEYYALQPGGGRNERFLCMSHPGALAAAVETVCHQFTERPDHHAFAFSPPDEPVLCHCANCIAAMHGGYGGEGNGHVSDAYFGFVFRLADRVKERFPDRFLTTMAYYNRCRPPEGVEGKRDNVLIQLASIQQCTVHSYADSHCWSRQEYAAMLRRWVELTHGQVFYEYDPHDWSHSQRPQWRSHGIAQDLRLLVSLGGWGFSNEGQMAWLPTGLNWYVRAHLAWNPDEDPDELERDFCDRFFGPAAGPMGRYYAAMERAIEQAPSHVFVTWEAGAEQDAMLVLFSRPLLEECRTLLDDAARLADAEPYAGRVAAFRAHFDRTEALVRARELMARCDFAAAIRATEDMTRAVERVGNSALLQDAGPWGGRCSADGVAAIARASLPWVDGAKGHLVAALPLVAQFRADPASEGVVQRWYLPGRGEGWREVRMDRAWEHEGAVTPQGRPYRGVGWYRVSVELDEQTGRTRWLYLPDLRGSSVTVWCNGHFAGHLAKAAGGDPVVKLGRLLQPGTNELVLRVDGGGGLGLPPLVVEPAGDLALWDEAQELQVFPARWRFRTDPAEVGEREGWQSEELDDSSWQMQPVPAWWEDTAVGDYDGVGWYRVRFLLPAEAAQRRLVLHFGAVDEEAWVYLNGELIGEHTAASTGQTVHQIWDQPFLVPVGNARPGEWNVLAVKVRDSQLKGGIFRPVGLYVLP